MRIIRLVAVVACVSLVSGCAATTRIELPHTDLEHWVLPLDRFIDTSAEATNYAEILLMGPCMRKAGFAWNVPWTDPYFGSTATSSDAGLRIFSLEVAETYGYRTAPRLNTGAAAWTEWAYRDMSDAEVEANHRCTEEVRQSELPLLPGSSQLGNSLASAAWEATSADQAVVDAADSWRACLKPAGIPDLPATPREMPSNWLRDHLSLTDAHSPPSVEEIRFATADAECREDSGYEEAFYNVLWDKEAVLVQDNADALMRIEAMVKKHRAKVDEIISENAPPAPK